ncbi:4'-phosphopantetheinyl transferase family protein [Flavobacterium chuncheonense]|uniref:4'-phosphopantetheinyl transferase family protein n=1 Tax=Flavobacterium chuncheonense TaxID=2026653 RepID=A0ABW5YPY4_9FLAO
MPLYKKIQVNNSTTVFVWKIEEDFNWLFRHVELRDVSLARLEKMKSESHQRGFLSVRHLLHEAGYTDFDLFYDENGKPNLKDGCHISITHSHNFSAIIVSKENVGIDLELQRDKIVRIADKFIDYEFEYLDKEAAEYIRKLTVIWAIKEAKYKMCNSKSLSFKDNMKVIAFQLNDSKGTAFIKQNDFEKSFMFSFEEFENFTLVYALEN